MIDKQAANDRPRVGVSSCLIGGMVRFNGGHARDRFVADFLADHFQWLSVCPEMGMGMSSPRETIRLAGETVSPSLIGTKSGADYTAPMAGFAKKFIERLESQRPHGFILKKKSPSCGLERVQVYSQKGERTGKRDGLFAAALKAAFPLMPMEDEGRLNDLDLRERFIQRVYMYKRWCDLNEAGVKPADLVRFHTRHKLLLMAHDPRGMTLLGRLVAKAGSENIDALAAEYGRQFSAILDKKPRKGTQANVLYHLLGYLKHRLNSGDKLELIHCIERFRRAEAPLGVALTLLDHHFRKIRDKWEAIDVYLHPYPTAFTMRYGV